MFKCNIIIPVFNNEGSLEKLYNTLKTEIINSNSQIIFETVFIDDGSIDNSIDVLLQIKSQNPENKIKIIKFTRNFGQQNAVIAGLKQSYSDCYVFISADMQDPTQLINDMLKYFIEEKYEIVIGTRAERKESYFRKITSKIFYSIMRKLSFPQMPKGGFDFTLFGNKTKEYLINNFDANPFIQGMMLWTGYKLKTIPYVRIKRQEGKSMWTFNKKLKSTIDGILSYSYFPIRLISLIGIIVALLGFIYAIVIIINRFVGNVPFKGFAALMVLILILSGIQMIMLGVIGEYLWRTFAQVKHKYQYVIEQIYE